MSFPLDVKILFMTIRNVLKHQGINAGVNDTMQVFQGNEAAVPVVSTVQMVQLMKMETNRTPVHVVIIGAVDTPE